MVKTIKYLQNFKTVDEVTGDTYYGNCQEWYKRNWQRLSGCGPTVVSNIIFYITHTMSGDTVLSSVRKKADCITFMEEVWKYVTPSFRGIPSTKLLEERIKKYAKAKNLMIQLTSFDIPKKKSERPEFRCLIKFIEDSIDNDTPIAFLNLNRGSEKEIDSWHWVTIVGIDVNTEDENNSFVEVLDEGKRKKVNLFNWFQTTSSGGGFVKFTI